MYIYIYICYLYKIYTPSITLSLINIRKRISIIKMFFFVINSTMLSQLFLFQFTFYFKIYKKKVLQFLKLLIKYKFV